MFTIKCPNGQCISAKSFEDAKIKASAYLHDAAHKCWVQIRDGHRLVATNSLGHMTGRFVDVVKS